MIPISVHLDIEEVLESVEMQVKDVIVISGGGGGGGNIQRNKSVTPSTETIYVRPDPGYDGLAQVTVHPIPNTYGRITYNGAVLTVS